MKGYKQSKKLVLSGRHLLLTVNVRKEEKDEIENKIRGISAIDKNGFPVMYNIEYSSKDEICVYGPNTSDKRLSALIGRQVYITKREIPFYKQHAFATDYL